MKPHFKDQRSRRRYNLWAHDPRCHWCKRVTVLPVQGVSISGKPPDDLATIDHIVSRYYREPGQRFAHAANTVLACWSCNQRRCDEENALVPIEELRVRAQNGHRKARGRDLRNPLLCLASLEEALSLRP